MTLELADLVPMLRFEHANAEFWVAKTGLDYWRGRAEAFSDALELTETLLDGN